MAYSLVFEIEDVSLVAAAILFLRETVGTFSALSGEDLERVVLWLLVSWSLDHESVFILHVRVTEVENERPFLRVEGGDLTITESNHVDLGRTVQIVLHHIEKLSVREEHFEQGSNVHIHVPWWLEDNGVVSGHCK